MLWKMWLLYWCSIPIRIWTDTQLPQNLNNSRFHKNGVTISEKFSPQKSFTSIVIRILHVQKNVLLVWSLVKLVAGEERFKYSFKTFTWWMLCNMFKNEICKFFLFLMKVNIISNKIIGGLCYTIILCISCNKMSINCKEMLFCKTLCFIFS